MKNRFKILFLLAAFASALVLAGCKNDSSSDDSGSSSSSSSSSSAEGSYKGILTGEDETLYMILTIGSNSVWASQGYTDNTYTTKNEAGTAGGSYTQDGNTVTLTVFGQTITCTTTDGWATMTVSGVYSGTLTRQ